jgi:hypothetical protein
MTKKVQEKQDEDLDLYNQISPKSDPIKNSRGSQAMSEDIKKDESKAQSFSD